MYNVQCSYYIQLKKELNIIFSVVRIPLAPSATCSFTKITIFQ
jgi:hypothetical protein